MSESLVMNFRWVLVASLSFPIAGVLSPAAFAGEPEWIEIASPHFSVVTDAGERRGREVATRFEQMRAVYATLMTNANVNIPVPLQIVAFRNTKELRQVSPLWNGKPIQLAALFQGAKTAVSSCSTCLWTIRGTWCFTNTLIS